MYILSNLLYYVNRKYLDVCVALKYIINIIEKVSENWFEKHYLLMWIIK